MLWLASFLTFQWLLQPTIESVLQKTNVEMGNNFDNLSSRETTVLLDYLCQQRISELKHLGVIHG